MEEEAAHRAQHQLPRFNASPSQLRLASAVNKPHFSRFRRENEIDHPIE